MPASHRFLDVPADAAALDALVELVPGADRTVAATQSTRRSAERPASCAPATTPAWSLGPQPRRTPAAGRRLVDRAGPRARPPRLYAELVPFGPAFRNARAPILVGPAGAVARLAAPDDLGPDVLPLGSPYPLDADDARGLRLDLALPGRVLFRRATRHATSSSKSPPGARRSAASFPSPRTPKGPRSTSGPRTARPSELVSGLRLADLFHGEDRRPGLDPRRRAPVRPLPRCARHAPTSCCWSSTPCRRSPSAFSRHASARGTKSWATSGESFVGARAAPKLLAEVICPKAAAAPANTIETVWPDGTHPTVELAGLPDGLHSFAAARRSASSSRGRRRSLGGRRLRAGDGTRAPAAPACSRRRRAEAHRRLRPGPAGGGAVGLDDQGGRGQGARRSPRHRLAQRRVTRIGAAPKRATCAPHERTVTAATRASTTTCSRCWC